MRFVADTHALVWYFQDSPRLSPTSKFLFDHTKEPRQIVIPTIVLSETLYFFRKYRMPLPFKEILKFLEAEERFEIFPLTTPILYQVIPFAHLEMHDALIVATALHLDLPLMTQDQEIMDSKLVEVLET